MSLGELNDLREKLQKELLTPKGKTILINGQKKDQIIKKSPSLTTTIKSDDKQSTKTTTKLIIESNNIFGNTLSSIDNKLLETNKTKEKDVKKDEHHKHSNGSSSSSSNSNRDKDKKHEHHHNNNNSSSSSTSTQHKDDKKESSNHRQKDREKDKDKIDDKRREKDRCSNSSNRSEKRSKDDDNNNNNKHRDHRDKDHHDRNREKERDRKDKGRDRDRCKQKDDESRKKDDKTSCKTKTVVESIQKAIVPSTTTTTSEGQTYKRLADKYNPKPRKISIDTKSDDKELTLPLKIPFLESTTTITTTTVSISTSNKLNENNRSLNTTNIIPQLLSPTPSSCSLESELSNSGFNNGGNNNNTNRRIIEPIPQPLNSLLANPSTTALINNVVSQLKQQETQQLRPLLQPNYQNLQQQQQQFNQPNYGLLSPPQQQPQQSLPLVQQNRPYITTNYPQQQQRNRLFTPFQPISSDPYYQDYYQQQSYYDNNRYLQPPPQQQQQQQHLDTDWRRELVIDNQLSRYDDRFNHDQRYGQYTQQQQQQQSYQYRDMRNNIDINTTAQQQQQQRIDYDQRSRLSIKSSSSSSYRESRDPRLNRSNRDNYNHGSSFKSRSQSRDLDNHNMNNNNNRSNIINNGNDDKFISPLDSLYNNGDVDYRNQTGKGYGKQNFKIPKIRKDDSSDTKKQNEDEEMIEQQQQQQQQVANDVNDENKEERIDKKQDDDQIVDEEKIVDSSSSLTNTKINNKDVDDNNDKDKKNEQEASNEITSSTNENDNNNIIKLPKETDIINQFLKKLLDNEQTRAAASSFIDNVSNTLNDDHLKQVVDTVKSITTTTATEATTIETATATTTIKDKPEEQQQEEQESEIDNEEDDEDIEEEEVDEEESADDEEEEEEEEEIKMKKKPKRRPTISSPSSSSSSSSNKNKKRKSNNSNKTKKKASVIERSKNRRQTTLITKQKIQKQTKQQPTKPKQRHKTELDLLHEDIQEMFIRDDVLTANGKRTCRVLTEDTMKQQQQQQETTKTRVTRRSVNLNNDNKIDSEKLKQMSNVRVVLPKIDVEMLEDDGKRYSLRSSNNINKDKSMTDDDNNDINDEKSIKTISNTTKKRLKSTSNNNNNDDDEVVTKKKRLDDDNNATTTTTTKVEEETTINDEKLYEYLEPDKSYYLEKTSHFKFPCRLCKFEGKNITQHYKFIHPDNEVLSSRLSPIKAEKAIKESLDKHLDNDNDNDNNNDKISQSKNYIFQCRFCDLIMSTRLTNFYEHITTHTGEYRHICEYCTFAASNRKRVRSHCLKQHKKERKITLPLIKQQIYGFICIECNFVQIQRKNVENHVNIYHLGDGNKIHRIHLSTRFDDNNHNKQQNHNNNTEKETTKKRLNDEIDDDNHNDVDEDDDDDDEDIDDNDDDNKIIEPVCKKLKIDDVDDDDDKIKECKKEIDMTVFTCNTDIFDDNQKIVEERLKTMCELNETVQKQRQSLNFIDELSNRLQQEQQQQQQHDEIIIKNEPIDHDDVENDNIDIDNPDEFDKIIEISNKKPTIQETTTTTTTTTNKYVNILQQNKDNRMINGVIEKLQGILKEEPKNDNDYDNCDYYNEFDNNKQNIIIEPPPLTPIIDKNLDNSRTIISAGFLNIIIYDNDDDDDDDVVDNLEYACRVPSCCYKTKERQLFLQHWHNDHVRINQTYKMTKCKICHCDIHATITEPLLTVFFNHIETEHSNLLMKTTTTTTKQQQNGDDIIEQEEETPFPFKISGVMSLADDTTNDEQQSQSIPPLIAINPQTTTTTTTPQQLQLKPIVLKEIKLTAQERLRTWKNPDALKTFLNYPANLYKCFGYFCKYTTNNRLLYEQHLKTAHKLLDEYVICIYCNDIKLPLIQSGLHIDLRHGNCLYSCSKCLYRAINKEYVIVHMKMKKHETNVVLGLPQQQQQQQQQGNVKKFVPKPKLDLANINDLLIQQLYKCGELNCNDNNDGYLYENEFEQHLIVKHHNQRYLCGYKNKFDQICGYKLYNFKQLIEHWYNYHKYSRYYCLLCKCGFQQPYLILEHYMLQHPNHELHIVDRHHKDNGASVKEIILNSYKTSTVLNQTISCDINETITDKSKTPPLLFDNSMDLDSSNDDNRLIIDEKLDDTPTTPPIKDPLSIDKTPLPPPPTTTTNNDEQQFALNESLEVKCLNVLGKDLYRCAVCMESFNNSKLLKIHLITNGKLCQDLSNNKQKPYRCVHCKRTFKNPNCLLEHIHYHGKLRFACSLCIRKFPLSFCLKLHMRNKHNVTQTVMLPLIPNKTNLETDDFILRPKTNDKINDNHLDITQLQPIQQQQQQSLDEQSNYDNYKVYGPNDIDLLPKRHIFIKNIKCKLCPYITKVRTNLIRHLQFHNDDDNNNDGNGNNNDMIINDNIDDCGDMMKQQKIVPNMAPVNPVPCLEKNEKMFDKMTNLAISSFTGGRMGNSANNNIKQEKDLQNVSDLPGYIPVNRRYVCCINDCNYLCPQESNLRHHLLALHKHDDKLICKHCKLQLHPNIDLYMKHLKLHHKNLYKCYYCTFISNFKHKIEKHSIDKHLNQLPKILTIRQMDNNDIIDDATTTTTNSDDTIVTSSSSSTSSTTTSPIISTKLMKQWHCGMCKYRSITKQEITNHILNRHDIDKQYKCTLCTYKNDDKTTFVQHFQIVHPKNDIDIICVYYNNDNNNNNNGIIQINQNFDTTPLWQRDRPRIRHIRGILFEEQTPITKPIKKQTKLPQQPPYLQQQQSNLDLAIDAVAKGITTTTTIEKDDDNDDEFTTESIIIIDDDDHNNNNDSDDNSNDDSSDGGDLLKIVKIEPHNNDDDEDDDNDDDDDDDDNNDDKNKLLLTKESIIKRYGNLFSSIIKSYRCPICRKFKVRKIDSIVYHILQELNYKRFSCKLCDYSSITQEEISTHFKQKHNINNNNNNVIKHDLPETLIIWLELLIKHQTKSILTLMEQSDLIHNGLDSATGTHKIYCSGCNKWFKHIRALKDHELIHWLEQTYTCGICDKNNKTIDLYITHHIKEHQNQQYLLKKNVYSIKSVLETLSLPVTTLTEQSSTSSLTTSPVTTTSTTTTNEQTYVCFYCMETTNTIETLHEHWKTQHESDNVEFYYKIIQQQQQEKQQQQQQQQQQQNQLYCCSICHEKDTDDNLRKHFLKQHPNKKYQPYQLICLECSKTFLTTKQIRTHFNQIHIKKRLTYCEIEKKLTNTNNYILCMKCPFRSCTNSGIRQHFRKHLRPFDCNWCGETFVAQVDVRNHQQKDHIDKPENFEENRERMRELDRLCKEAQIKNIKESDQTTTTTTTIIPQKTRAVAKKSTGAPFIRKDPPSTTTTMKKKNLIDLVDEIEVIDEVSSNNL